MVALIAAIIKSEKYPAFAKIPRAKINNKIDIAK